MKQLKTRWFVTLIFLRTGSGSERWAASHIMPLIIKITLVAYAVFFGFVALLAVCVKRSLNHQLHALGESACPNCGSRYGLDLAERTRHEHGASCKDTQKKKPNFHFYFQRFWEIRCPKCGAEARFYYEKKNLVESRLDPNYATTASQNR